jgi:anti-sigma B factor antagonist
MPLKIEENTVSPNVAVYRLSGRLTAGLEVSALEAAFEKTATSGVTRVVVDMREVYYVDSSGIGALVAGLTRMKKASGSVRLAAVDERVSKILKMTHVDALLPMDGTIEDACKNIEG